MQPHVIFLSTIFLSLSVLVVSVTTTRPVFHPPSTLAPSFFFPCISCIPCIPWFPLRLHGVLSVSLLLAPSLACSPSSANTDRADNSPAATEKLLDINGHQIDLTSDSTTKALALIFILPDCPIANSFLPEINRLHDTFSPKGVKLLLVHVDPDVTAEKARAHAAEYQIQPSVLLDPQHDLVKKASPTISPEAVVFSPQGQIVYRGRINDQYVGLGKRRAAVTSHDLKNSLDAILANKLVLEPRTQAIGCPIPIISTTK